MFLGTTGLRGDQRYYIHVDSLTKLGLSYNQSAVLLLPGQEDGSLTSSRVNVSCNVLGDDSAQKHWLNSYRRWGFHVKSCLLKDTSVLTRLFRC